MTKPKGVFKKVKNKGNRYYRTNTTVKSEVDVEVSVSNHTTTKVSTPPSSSKRKLDKSNIMYTKDNMSELDKNVIIDLNILSSVIEKFACCKLCGGQIRLQEDSSKRNGLVCSFSFSCVECDNEKQFYSSEKCNDNNLYETNVRFVYGLRCIGRGLSSGKTLCALMNFPCPPTNYSKYRSVLGEKLKTVAEESMKLATEEAVAENDNSRNITIAFDGTWQKRGFQSKNSCAAVTSIDTGKVLDVEVLSKHCHGCSFLAKNEEKKKKHEPHCQKSYVGSSGGMESASAVIIFQRSLSERGVRYVEFIGDGDSSSFKSVVDSRPYGDLIPKKLECVCHVQKRMGTRLRKIRSELSKTVLSDGKKMRGRLPDSVIDQLTAYYGQAIRENSHDLEGMKRAVWATFFHKASTNDQPNHHLCNIKWCKYKQAEAAGTVNNFSHKNSLPAAVMWAIKPIYKDLAHPDLLKKCLTGKTQNVNESFNNIVWSRIPKNVFVGLQTLKLGVYDAVITFNDGNTARLKVLEKLGVKIGFNTAGILKNLDKERIAKAEVQAQKMTQEARSAGRKRRLNLEDVGKNEEYEAGGF